jgi:CrcB protein
VKHDFFSSDARLFLFTGVAGGFTTFSAFGLETFYLLRRHEVLVAAGYVASSVLVGLAVLWLGFVLVSPRT